MRVELIVRPAVGVTGTSRYAEGLCQGLEGLGVEVGLAAVTPPLGEGLPRRVLERLGLDVNAFLSSYPLRVRVGAADLYHLTSQTYASLLVTQRFARPVVVSVLDILPYLLRRDPTLNTLQHPVDAAFYRLALQGLKRADALVAISSYTARTLVEALGLPPERIHVVYPAVDLTGFAPQAVPDEFLARYGLRRDLHYLLFVGTNDPRKNLPAALRALAILRERRGDVRLIKVGADPFPREAEAMQRLIAELGLQEDVILAGRVSARDLTLFYNVSSALLFPSLYEGFGIPVVEAMACGTPVVCSAVTSLPEVAGDAALYVEPGSPEALAVGVEHLLDDADLRESLQRRGLQQAARFGESEAIQQLWEVYRGLAG